MNLPDSDSEDELPPGWEERVTVDGNVYYANHLTKQTQWTHPRTGRKKIVGGELPFGWERCTDNNTGKVVYVDHENKRTTYTDPRLAFAVEQKEHVNDYRQRFDASSTALQVLHGRDLSGKTALITGANTGIGFETARSLARHGCNIILACRNIKAANEAIAAFDEERAGAKEKCEAIQLDLASLQSVLFFTEIVKDTYQRIDLLILNAGIFGLPFTKTENDFEKTFQVNHLSHFFLTLHLKPLLVTGSRIVIVSSESHRYSDINVENMSPSHLSPDSSHNYFDMRAYNNSKLCNILFARQLAKNLQSQGISVFSLHPGNMVSTRLSRNWWLYRFLFAVVRPFTKSLQQAASTTIYCATAHELIGVTATQRTKALLSLERNELEAIYYLTESHLPGLRTTATFRYEKAKADGIKALGMTKDHVQFKCDKSASMNNIKTMLDKLEELPKEWTLVQLTPKFNALKNGTISKESVTEGIHITVFYCGRNMPKPFCVTVPQPIDRISGKVVEIRKEMDSIIQENDSLLNVDMKGKKPSAMDIENYCLSRHKLTNRLQNLVKDMQDLWLGEWRCLLIGNIPNGDSNILKEILTNTLPKHGRTNVSDKITCILKCLVKSLSYLKLNEVKKLLRYCFPDDDALVTALAKVLYSGSQCNTSKTKRDPVILLLDESLDVYPWEMIDVLLEHPVTRMPSFHFTYGLFKEHEQTITDGVKNDIDQNVGKFIINPGLDLEDMQKRQSDFYDYWLPDWTGLTGVAPAAEEFENLLLESSIFCYHGHGNGTKYIPCNKIQKLRINCVVCLFGCSSSSYVSLGPKVEMYGVHQMYLLACSPCIVGCLWVMTDKCLDYISSAFLSVWLPNKRAKSRWLEEVATRWRGDIFAKKLDDICEPELLRAIAHVKATTLHYITRASLVVRGLPVKLKE